MSSYKLDKQLAPDGSSITIKACGNMGIEAAAELHAALMESVSSVKTVKLDLQQVDRVDITTLQIICSACKTAAANGCKLFSDYMLPECLKKENALTGAHIATRCKQNNDEPCQWFVGGK